MTRIAVLGANGQVGAELCLLLAQQAGVEVVPVCRSRMGSAYLRYRGISCRHGQAADPNQAKGLFGDCDVIANLALVGALSNPKAAREINRALLRNVVTHAMPKAKHIYFSTMSVYGDAEQGKAFAVRNSYGQDKWRSEKLVRSFDGQARKRSYIFRLGHVCGDLQGITYQIREQLQGRIVQVADPERASNTVYVATIADAILKVASGSVAPDTYDLMNVPQWTWRQVLSYEARLLGVKHELEVVGDPKRARLTQVFKRSILGAALAGSQNQLIRRFASRIVPKLPLNWYYKVKAAHAVQTAAADINALRKSVTPLTAVFRVPVGDKFVPGLEETAALLSRATYRVYSDPSIGVWPGELPVSRVAIVSDASFTALASES